MLDEPDNFLNYDASEEFRVVSQFRRLMTDSERALQGDFRGTAACPAVPEYA